MFALSSWSWHVYKHCSRCYIACKVDANELLEDHDNGEKEILFKKNPLHNLKSMADIQALLAGCTEQEQEILLCNLYQLSNLLKSSRHR